MASGPGPAVAIRARPQGLSGGSAGAGSGASPQGTGQPSLAMHAPRGTSPRGDRPAAGGAGGNSCLERPGNPLAPSVAGAPPEPSELRAAVDDDRPAGKSAQLSQLRWPPSPPICRQGRGKLMHAALLDAPARPGRMGKPLQALLYTVAAVPLRGGRGGQTCGITGRSHPGDHEGDPGRRRPCSACQRPAEGRPVA